MPGARSLVWVASALLIVGLGACSTASTHPPAESQSSLLRLPSEETTSTQPRSASRSTGQSIAALAEQMVGIPYQYGGASPGGFDCSGLVYYSHREAGISVPRTSRAQLQAAQRISLQQARPGDLLFFKSRNNSHVAIYLGEDTFVHAPSTGKRVSPASLKNDYYRTHLVAVGRLH